MVVILTVFVSPMVGGGAGTTGVVGTGVGDGVGRVAVVGVGMGVGMGVELGVEVELGVGVSAASKREFRSRNFLHATYACAYARIQADGVCK